MLKRRRVVVVLAPSAWILFLLCGGVDVPIPTDPRDFLGLLSYRSVTRTGGALHALLLCPKSGPAAAEGGRQTRRSSPCRRLPLRVSRGRLQQQCQSTNPFLLPTHVSRQLLYAHARSKHLMPLAMAIKLQFSNVGFQTSSAHW